VVNNNNNNLNRVNNHLPENQVEEKKEKNKANQLQVLVDSKHSITAKINSHKVEAITNNIPKAHNNNNKVVIQINIMYKVKEESRKIIQLLDFNCLHHI